MGSSKSKNKSKKQQISIVENFKFPNKLEERIEILEKDQNNFINFNIGGQIFKISRSVILNSPYDSYFKKAILSDGINNNTNEEIFIDRSSEDFELILHILRTSYLKTCLKDGFQHSKLITSIRNNITNIEIFKEDLKYYFEKDYETVLNDYELKVALEIKDCNNLIEDYELIKSDKDDRIDFMFYRSKNIKELFNLYCRKGFFFEVGGGIIIKLSTSKSINRIDIRPFVFDNNYWKLEDCPQINVFFKQSNKEWKFINTFELILDKENIASLFIDTCHTNALKLTTEGLDNILSISYIKIF